MSITISNDQVARFLARPLWLSGETDFKTKTITLTVSVCFRKLSSGLSLPTIGGGPLQPIIDAAKEVIKYGCDLSAAEAALAESLVLEGIEKHWSRKVSGGYTVSVKTVRAQPLLPIQAINVLLLRPVKADLPQGIGKRSFNLAAILEGLPTVDFFDPELEVPKPTDAAYGITPEKRKRAAYDDFRETGAHEFGHSVLRVIKKGGVMHSLTHKGTSTLGQAPNDQSPAYPSTGEVDVMVYHKAGTDPYFTEKRYSSTFATEEDVEGLVDRAVYPPWMPG